jgi:hypothetical protein
MAGHALIDAHCLNVDEPGLLLVMYIHLTYLILNQPIFLGGLKFCGRHG